MKKFKYEKQLMLALAIVTILSGLLLFGVQQVATLTSGNVFGFAIVNIMGIATVVYGLLGLTKAFGKKQ